MSRSVWFRTVTALLCAGAVQAAMAQSGPPLTVSQAELAAAAWCDPSVAPGTGRQAVLLIHGTGSTPHESWSWNYMNALPAAGYGVCTVTLPERSVGSFTRSAEFAVYAARYAYQRSGSKIAIIGHSQGGTIAAWIAKFWPDVARNATDVISLAGVMQGSGFASTACAPGACTPLLWQLRIGAQHMAALSGSPMQKGAAITSIGTLLDELVFPQPLASTFPGTSNITLQTVCPLRATEHGLMVSDAVVYALVLDALRNAGGAVASRVSPLTCLQVSLPGTDPTGAAGFLNTIAALGLGLTDVSQFVTREPPLPAYAAPYANPGTP
ncbi:esterase/lipase family protein [Rhizobacter fulvus]